MAIIYHDEYNKKVGVATDDEIKMRKFALHMVEQAFASSSDAICVQLVMIGDLGFKIKVIKDGE